MSEQRKYRSWTAQQKLEIARWRRRTGRTRPPRRWPDCTRRRNSAFWEVKALDAVTLFAHPELAGTRLNPSCLDDAAAKELSVLARRRRDDDHEAGLLDHDEERRYVALVEQAAGAPGIFARRRSERAEAEKLEALARAERRHPQAESLVAACMAEDDLLDGLRRKLRPDALVVDEYGREVPGAVADRIYDLDNVAALFVIVSLIAANGGDDIVVKEHGVLAADLPHLPQGSLAQLRRNGWLLVTSEGTGTRVGLGERMRRIAERWAIPLSDPPVGSTPGAHLKPRLAPD